MEANIIEPFLLGFIQLTEMLSGKSVSVTRLVIEDPKGSDVMPIFVRLKSVSITITVTALNE